MADGQPLLRALRRWDLAAVAVNGIIGAGIFGLPSKVFALIGVHSLLAFLACAAVVTLIILCFAEVGSRFRDTGGPYLYARQAFGPVIGFEVGWLMYLARLSAFAANANLLVGYLGAFWPAASSGAPRAGIIIALTLMLTLVNVLGIRDAARASNFFTIAKLIPLALFIGVGLFFVSRARFAAAAPPALTDFSKAVLLLVYAFTGFEMAVIPAGEVRDPQRDLPVALLSALGLVATVYILIQVVCIGTLPGLASSDRPLADAARSFIGPSGAAIISAGAAVSIIGNLNVLILAASRLPFAMAERAELPRILAATHPRFRTPAPAILLTGAIALTLSLSGSFIQALTLSTLTRLLAYGATCLSLPRLRRRPAAPAAKFRVPGGTVVSIASLALITWLLLSCSRTEALNTAGAGLLGLLIYLASTRLMRSQNGERLERRSIAHNSANPER